MERWGDVLRRLLLLSSLWALGCGLHDECKNYHLQFERVFSVPGDVAMLNSTLLTPSVFNLSAEPYNVTWYQLHSDQPISNQSGRVLAVGETLWFLNVTLADAGRYVTVVRTPRQCFRQETKLVVDLALSQCGRPRTSGQVLTKGVTDHLNCPLKDSVISKLHNYVIPYDITWYKGCEQISDGADRFHYWGTSLKVDGVESADQDLYTCTLHFNIAGVRGSVSETIDAQVKGDFCLLPQIHEPAKDCVRAELGSNVTKRCLVFVPCEGSPLLDVEVSWIVLEQNKYILDDPNQRIYTTQERFEWQDRGVLIDRWLVISELQEQDLNLNYTCKVWSGRGSPSCYFTLLPKEPELLNLVSVLLSSCLLLLLFLLCVSVYHVFKLELVLWFRRTFPTLYSHSGADGKLYDAYVAFPQRCSSGWTHEVEKFALHTLPQVLEEACGYSLFIPDRDSLPGEAVVDSVEENLKVSRRIILLYTASTFSSKYCSNNNTLLSRPTEDHSQTDHLITSKDHLNTSKDHLNTSKENLSTSKENLNTSKEHLNPSKERLNLSKDHLNPSKEQLNTSKDNLNSSKDHLTTSKKHLNTSKEHLNNSKEPLNSSKEPLNSSKEHLNNSKEQLTTSQVDINIKNNYLNINKNQLTTSKDNLNTSKELVNTRKVHFSPSEEPSSECLHSCEDSCVHARTQLECVAAMHRALLDRSLKVILVELEELGPSDLEQLPDSVRHLRQTQGAVCWWRTRGTVGTPWRTGCSRRTGDTEMALSSCLSPSCRFWKEVRYRMPV